MKPIQVFNGMDQSIAKTPTKAYDQTVLSVTSPNGSTSNVSGVSRTPLKGPILQQHARLEFKSPNRSPLTETVTLEPFSANAGNVQRNGGTFKSPFQSKGMMDSQEMEMQKENSGENELNLSTKLETLLSGLRTPGQKTFQKRTTGNPMTPLKSVLMDIKELTTNINLLDADDSTLDVSIGSTTSTKSVEELEKEVDVLKKKNYMLESAVHLQQFENDQLCEAYNVVRDTNGDSERVERGDWVVGESKRMLEALHDELRLQFETSKSFQASMIGGENDVSDVSMMTDNGAVGTDDFRAYVEATPAQNLIRAATSGNSGGSRGSSRSMDQSAFGMVSSPKTMIKKLIRETPDEEKQTTRKSTITGKTKAKKLKKEREARLAAQKMSMIKYNDVETHDPVLRVMGLPSLSEIQQEFGNPIVIMFIVVLFCLQLLVYVHFNSRRMIRYRPPA